MTVQHEENPRHGVEWSKPSTLPSTWRDVAAFLGYALVIVGCIVATLLGGSFCGATVCFLGLLLLLLACALEGARHGH